MAGRRRCPACLRAEKTAASQTDAARTMDIVTMKYHTHFDENGNPVLTSTRERLTKRSRGYLWQDPVHECIPLSGRIVQSDIAIWHQKPVPQTTSMRNLRIYESGGAGRRHAASAILFCPRAEGPRPLCAAVLLHTLPGRADRLVGGQYRRPALFAACYNAQANRICVEACLLRSFGILMFAQGKYAANSATITNGAQTTATPSHGLRSQPS